MKRVAYLTGTFDTFHQDHIKFLKGCKRTVYTHSWCDN